MKTTKTILTLAIIGALPFAANATGPVVAVGPAHASSNAAVVATANAPYVTVTPTQADESHIATTAYVKGAYNDAIAAVNKVNSDKQGKLERDDEADGTGDMDTYVIGSGSFLDALRDDDIGNNYYDGYFEMSLVSAKAVAEGILNQRVKIYTTWDDDTASATAEVPLITATAQQ